MYLLLPSLALAHSQVPREMRKFVATERVDVALDVTNLNSFSQSYEVLVKGQVLGVFTLKPDETRKVQLNLRVEESDKWMHKIVSTRSIPREGENLRTEIETLISLYRPTIKGVEQ